MPGKPSKASVKAAQYLEANPTLLITAAKIAEMFDLSVSSVSGSRYWKKYRAGLKAQQDKSCEFAARTDA